MTDAPTHAEDGTGPHRLDTAAAVFGERASTALRYGEILATDAITRGLLGPREGPRVWDRHLLNSVAPAALIPTGATVLDLGSGAGLPGIPLALLRPDLTVILLEPLQRRVNFLQECVDRLALSSVTVCHARAQDIEPGVADTVVARAVAPLERLVPLAMRLTRQGGQMLALKGQRAAVELAAARRQHPRVALDLITVAVSPGQDVVVARGRAAPASRA